MRDWLTFIIVLLIVGVLLDGIRRMRAHRRESLRMSRNVSRADGSVGEGEYEEELSSSEFPAGGPRVVGVRDTSDLAHVNQNLRESYVESRKTRGAPRRKAEQERLKLDTPVPMLMDSVEENTVQESPRLSEHEPALGSLDNLDDDYDTATADHREGTHIEPEALEDEDDFIQSSPYQPLTKAEARADQQEQVAPVKRPADPPQPAPKEPQSEPEPRPAPDEVLVINVMARRGEMFAGPALLDAMLAQGLRFGDMDIFHRHESADGRGKILFSVANMVVPGTFALEAMDEFQSPGVSMFLSLPIASDSLAAYNLMAESAQNIAQLLGGELKDENRSVMTRQTIEHGRQRVLEYERKRRLAKA